MGHIFICNTSYPNTHNNGKHTHGSGGYFTYYSLLFIQLRPMLHILIFNRLRLERRAENPHFRHSLLYEFTVAASMPAFPFFPNPLSRLNCPAGALLLLYSGARRIFFPPPSQS